MATGPMHGFPKPTLPEKSEVDRGAIMFQPILIVTSPVCTRNIFCLNCRTQKTCLLLNLNYLLNVKDLGMSLSHLFKVGESYLPIFFSIDGVLGTRTQGGRMVGADESTELWRHPVTYLFSAYKGHKRDILLTKSVPWHTGRVIVSYFMPP